MTLDKNKGALSDGERLRQLRSGAKLDQRMIEQLEDQLSHLRQEQARRLSEIASITDGVARVDDKGDGSP